MKIRFATVKDSENLLKIYAQYIETPITFEYELPSVEEFSHRIEFISEDYPYIVLEENDEILGYAYAHRFKERDAYAWGAELSIYMDKNIHSKGYGKKLYGILIELLRLQGVKTAYACVTSANVQSEKFHEHLDFKKCAEFSNAGFKLGKWYGITWYELPINNYDVNPTKVKSIKDLDKNLVEDVFNSYIN